MIEYILEFSAIAYIILALFYELKIRSEAKKVNKTIEGMTYVTLGLVLKPMLNIMLLKPYKISKEFQPYALMFAFIHYWIIGVLIILIVEG